MMMKILKNILIPAFIAAVIPVLAQDVEFTASGKGNVQVGEQFRVVYSVNQQASGFRGPDFDGFKVLSGPSQSTNQSYQFVNGKVSQSFQVTYTYYLQAVKEGTYTIGPASVVVEGRTYNSNPFEVKVTQASGQPPAATPGGGRGHPQQGRGAPAKEDVYIRASVDKSRGYLGEQIIITYKIFTTIPVSQINISKFSSFPGFWYKNLLNENDPLRQYSEVINGREYIVADLRKIALFPQRSGEIRIEPMELECMAQVRVEGGRTRDPFFDSFFNDPFFNRNIQNVKLVLESNAITLDVRPLPTEGRPPYFGGAVGSFTLSARTDKTTLKTNEALTLTATVSGKGNLELIDALPFSFPPDFEIFDPKVTNNITYSPTGASGSRTFEYLVIPRNAGEFQIRPVDFAYFDPSRQSYNSHSTPLFSISVEKGADETGGISYSGVSQKNIQFIGSDIRHIRTGQMNLQPVNTMLFGSTSFILWLVLPLLAFIALLAYVRFLRKRNSNLALMKNRKANKVARNNLKNASRYLQNNQVSEFFEEISRALWGYISNKFDMPLADLSIDNVNQRLSKRGVSQERIGQFTGVLEKCEYARFAPGEKTGRMQEIYQDALLVISQIEQELR